MRQKFVTKWIRLFFTKCIGSSASNDATTGRKIFSNIQGNTVLAIMKTLRSQIWKKSHFGYNVSNMFLI